MSAPTVVPGDGISAPIESVPVGAVYVVGGTRPGGLSTEEAQTRFVEYGPNVLQSVQPRPFVVRFGAHFTHLMALLLWAGSIAALVAGLGVLCVAIVLVNVINGVFSYWQEHKADKATEALRRLLPVHARVMRDGREVQLSAEELVPGDVILLEEGDRISAGRSASSSTPSSESISPRSRARRPRSARPPSRHRLPPVTERTHPTWCSPAPTSRPAAGRRS